MYFLGLILFLPLIFFLEFGANSASPGQDDNSYLTTSVDYENGLLMISTLEGTLIAVDQKTGKTKWTFINEPAVKVYMKHNTHLSPVFLPDPKDGSLYLLNVEGKRGLSKLPFSIQQLVADSPTRNQDGIFYFGKKRDSWISIDNITGDKKILVNTEEFEKVCPIKSPNIFFIGRTEYNLALIDSKMNNNYWNITYYDYSSRTLPSDHLHKYGYLHVASSASGRVRTFNKKTGLLEWERDFGSPMISLYLLWGKDVFSLPFTTAAESSLNLLPSEEMQLTLFIGEHNFGYYALPSFADSEVPILTDTLHPARFLISGPEDKVSPQNALILGHYKVPVTPSAPLRITGKHKTQQIIYNDVNYSTLLTNHDREALFYLSPESKILGLVIAIIVTFFGGMFFYLIRQVREIKQSSQGNNQMSSINLTYNIQKGIITVGKISFDTQKILGKGCEGTFVFQGEFDGRDVAVKRLLPECFSIADREVQLLRESDSHSNVIRYFSTEQDNQFRYIALELCSATLQDYVEKGIYKEDISSVDVLRQATSGLEHLHSLKIVHRDIKPHNILLALGSKEYKVRAMISDFGLCKKLPSGKNSFSRKSGITGTEGWIAPEMMTSGRVMSAVDIFSLGCVFYYTIVGVHPFGDSLRRQSNILLGEFKISQLADELWKSLIFKMISSIPSERPTALIVKNHPVFWNKTTILTFLQDVSDFIDKDRIESPLLHELEKGGDVIHKGNWKQLIDAEVAEDIGKYRSYRGDSVRDLLRALRNKRHHYRDLTKAAQEILGIRVESYMDYWQSRFPHLLFHVWSSMQLARSEPCLIQYYSTLYTFSYDKTDYIPQWITDMKVWEQGLEKKKMKNSFYYKIKHKPMRLSLQESNNAQLDDMNKWIKCGEKTGVWRPRVVRKSSEENIT